MTMHDTHKRPEHVNPEREMFGRSMDDTAKMRLTQQDWIDAGATVIREAKSLEEARELLDMLGITEHLKGRGMTSSTSMPLFNSQETVR